MDESFRESFDARDWAKAFVERVKENPGIATDEGTMSGWFANAIMRGHDEAARKAEAAAPQVPNEWQRKVEGATSKMLDACVSIATDKGQTDSMKLEAVASGAKLLGILYNAGYGSW